MTARKTDTDQYTKFHMSPEEALKLLADIARGDMGKFIKVGKSGTFQIDFSKAKDETKLLKKIKYKPNKFGIEYEIELYSALDALDKQLRVHGSYRDNPPITRDEFGNFSIPADKIPPLFVGAYRDIVQKLHTEYIFKGGRGSAKSSFISLAFLYKLIDNPQVHGLALRQVGETLRDSVFARLQWAINILGLSDQFKSTTSPMEIEYIPTGQKIYFRGADDPGKIKSITPAFGYIGIVWFEEFDQFHGLNGIRTIEQSIRGGDDVIYFKSFNPPPTKSNWANKYLEIPKATQYQHFSNYLGIPEAYLKNEEIRKTISLEEIIKMYASQAIPVEWLGRPWLDEAEHLRNVNPSAYEHEYLGIPVNDGGMVFTNVVIRPITDDEISQFDRVLHGQDWGYYPDPASYGKMHYDAARRALYIFGELREWKKSNDALYKALIDSKLYNPDELLIADSAEPKSVNDFRAYGANCRGAEKGPESVRYSMKWLQGLTSIIIDNQRAPYHAEEFLNYEFERTKDGEIISEYPDKNNHAIDDVRYATNLIWRKRGE